MKLPLRKMPAQSPSALLKHAPSTMPVSSIKWCWSTFRSPLIEPLKSKRPCLQKERSIWSKKPIGFSMLHFPLPSRFSSSEICVSPVVRSIFAVLIKALPSVIHIQRCPLHQDSGVLVEVLELHFLLRPF